MATRSTNSFGAMVFGMVLQMAKKFLLIETKTKISFLVLEIVLLSLLSSIGFINFSDDWYIIQKHSVFNQYGVKIGWFWTWFVVAPFIYFSTKAEGRGPLRDLARLLAATFLWWICIEGFHVFLRYTGQDISGHCFLMVYSTLIVSEEATAFINLDQVEQRQQRNSREKNEATRWVQWFLIGMFVLSILWIKQLAISALFYHTIFDKVMGTIMAIGCWAVTYNGIYRNGFLELPNKKTKKRGY